MPDIVAGLQGLSISDRVAAAVKKFEEKQLWSNQEWLEARVQRAETAQPGAILDEQAALANCLGFDDCTSCTSGLGISSASEILTRALDMGQQDSGTSPPVSKEELQDFVERLHTGVNEPFDKDDPQYSPLQLPSDYISLLEVSDGIYETDLRKSGVPGIDSVRNPSPERMTHTENGESAIDEDGCLLLPLGEDMWRDGWELGAGFQLGQGTPENRSFMVYYYCSRDEQTSKGPKLQGDEIRDEQREWKWRILFSQEVSPRLRCTEEEREHVFEGVVDWLDWYGAWRARESVEMEEFPAWYAEKVEDVAAMYGDYIDEDPSETDDYGGCACGMCYRGAETCTSALK